MKAVVLHGPDNYPNNYEVMDIEKPTCGKRDILLKMKAAALCGTDKRIFTGGKTKGVRPDSVVGHEICGLIEEVGEEVKGFEVGEKVAIANVIPCGHCAACLSGRENACLNRKAIGYEFNGGFEEYVLIPEVCIESGNVVKLPESVSYAAGALIEPLACCIRGLANTGTGFNDTVLIIGAGPIGLMHLQLSLIAGAQKVIVSELDPEKRELAKNKKRHAKEVLILMIINVLYYQHQMMIKGVLLQQMAGVKNIIRLANFIMKRSLLTQRLIVSLLE